MRTNLVEQFLSCLGIFLITLILSNEIVLLSYGFAETKFCKSTKENTCVILCRNWDFESRSGGFNEILETEEKNFKTCTLMLERCTNIHTTWKLTTNTSPKIVVLKIVHTPIDLNQVNLNIFKNLQSLTIENTTTESLRLETFRQLPKLRQLYIKSPNLIKWVDEDFIQNLSLDYVQIFDLILNQLWTTNFLKNLTGGSEIYALNSFRNSNLVTCDFELKFERKERKYLKNYKMACAHPELIKYQEYFPQNCTFRVVGEHNPQATAIQYLPIIRDPQQKFTITNVEPGLIDINLSDTIDSDKVFLWYGNYANTTSPQFNCLKIPQEIFRMQVTPNTEYIICLATIFHTQIEIFSCLPYKTKPPYEEQPWLTNKSIPFLIISISVVFLISLATGALLLYLSVRKNPSLIRGRERVIEVKTHDKAQVLIMPRGYESPSQPEVAPLVLAKPPLMRPVSCDTVSTVSYVSAHQPTQLEILNYRLTRLRELFQRNNNLPPPVPMHVATPERRRLPPHVDLLLEYEWYTITTTTQC